MNDTYMGSTKAGMDWSSFNWWGLFLLMMGVAWLGEEVGWWTFNWSMVGPLALVFAGLMLFIGRGRK